MGADVGNQDRGAGRQDAVDDRVVGRLELRSLLGREGNHAVAVEDGPDGDPRRLLEEHDAGAVEGDQPSQAVEQGRQHGFAVEAAGERHGRLAQCVGDGPGAPLGLVREPSVGHVPGNAQHRRYGAPWPGFRNEPAVEVPRPIRGRKCELESLGPSSREDPPQGCVPRLDQLGRHPQFAVRLAHEVLRWAAGHALDRRADVEVSQIVGQSAR